MQTVSDTRLPRLLYLSDVPVEATVGGAALLYRLLQNYPDPLKILEPYRLQPPLEKRLPHIDYTTFYVGSDRLLHSRFTSLYQAYLLLIARSRSQQFHQLIQSFQPEAILTVVAGFSWLTAAALAQQFQLPLHLIVHDDYQDENLGWGMQNWLKHHLTKTYQYATSRLCISPYMVECYEQRYGAIGTVLYPCQAADSSQFPHVPDRPPSRTSLVFVYAGSINSQGYLAALITLASVLKNWNSQLIIYSQISEDFIERNGLNQSNITIRALLPVNQLILTLRHEADVLFVPMSFAERDRSNMELSFPSKLTDYTAVGLPLLIWGPAYCSAARWATENPGVAEVVMAEDREKLTIAVENLTDPAHRLRLGGQALHQGRAYFSHAAITQLFYQSIAKS